MDSSFPKTEILKLPKEAVNQFLVKQVDRSKKGEIRNQQGIVLWKFRGTFFIHHSSTCV